MKLNRTIKRYVRNALFAILPMMSACDYLDVIPPKQPDFDDTMKDESATLGFLFSCYAGESTYNYWAQGSSGSVSHATDEYVHSKDWDWPHYQMLFGTVSPSKDIGNWTNLYNYIGYVHFFLEQLEQLNPVGLTEEYKNQLRAEAWFLEAYYHFMLLENYGPIPIIETKTDQNIMPQDIPGRSHFDYCVNWIVGKLDEAAKILPQKRNMEDLGRADATICKCLKARVLLYAASPLWNGEFIFPDWKNTHYETPGYGLELVSHEYKAEKWERALTACEEALKAAQEAGYKLFDIETANTRAALENVPLPFIPGKEENTPENNKFKERVRMLQYMMTVHEGNGNKEIIWGDSNINSSIQSYEMKSRSPLRIVRHSNGTWLGGWKGTGLTWNAVNRFYTDKGLPPAKDKDFCNGSKDEWLKRYYEDKESPELAKDQLDSKEIISDIVKFNVGREPRYYAWVAFDGCEYMPLISNNSPLWLNLKNPNTNGYSLTETRNQTGTGFLNKKYITPNGSWLASGGAVGEKFRFPLIRMAELYLNLAECYAALNNTGKALENLNIIRERAGVPDLTEADLSIMDLTEWVRNERAIELHVEGHRYYDVRRWCIAGQVMQPSEFKGLNGMTVSPSFEDFNQVVPIDQPIQWNDKQYLVPITNSELYGNPQLVQAPGY